MLQDADITGNAWAFRATGSYYYMPDYGFNDKLSSWLNERGLDARWYYNVSGVPNPNRCMGVGGRREHLPKEDNDQMSALYIYNSSTVC